MTKRLIDYIPDHDVLFNLEPEELAGSTQISLILQHLSVKRTHQGAIR